MAPPSPKSRSRRSSSIAADVRRRRRRDQPRRRRFEALDIDSLDLAELSQIIEEQFGVELKSADVAEIKTVGDAIDLSRSAPEPMEPRSSSPGRRGHAARRRRARAARALERRRLRDRGRRGPLRGLRPARTTSRSRRRAAPTASRSSRSAACERGARRRRLGATELPYDAERHRLRARHGHRRHRDARSTARTRCASAAAEHVSPLAVPLMMGNAAAAAVSMRHGLRGPSFAVCQRCASGAHAIGTAMRTLQHGDADAVVAGGAEAALTPLARAAFSALDALSAQRHLAPVRRAPRRLRDGRGRRRAGARARGRRAARGARMLGTIRGYGATSDAHHLTAPREDGRGQAARDRQPRSPTPASRPRTSTTSTPTAPRRRSTTAPRRSRIKPALGEHAQRIPVSSTKSAIGHLLGAAGAVEAVATLLALRDRVAPPTLGLSEPDEDLDLDYVPDARAAARRTTATGPRSRCPTRSASAATTPCCAWRRHDARPARARPREGGAREPRLLSAPTSACPRLAAADPGSLQLLRTEVLSRRMGEQARPGDGVLGATRASTGARSPARPGRVLRRRLARRGARGDGRRSPRARRARARARDRLRRVRRRAHAGGPRRALRLRRDLPQARRACPGSCRRSR